MAGGGVGGAGDGTANGGHAPLGTEYTLQGVMRFLQTEWHRHERDRNAWEIERAEMRSRIARLEGEARTAKRLHDSLGKHVKILEIALTREREKMRSLSRGEKPELPADPRKAAREELKAVNNEAYSKGVRLHDSDFLGEDALYHGLRQDIEREKSRNYLSKCSAEIAYHVMPATHPPPELTEQDLSNHVFQNPPSSQPALQDAYVHHQQAQQHTQQQAHQQAQQQAQQQAPPSSAKQPQTNHIDGIREASGSNQQSVPPFLNNENPVLARPNNQVNDVIGTSRDTPERRSQDQAHALPLTAIDGRKPSLAQQTPNQEPAGSAAPDSDEQMKPVNQPREEDTSRAPKDAQAETGEGWNFEEDSSEQVDLPPPDVPLPHRQDTDVFPNANLTTSKSPPRLGSHRRKSSGMARRRSDGSSDIRELSASLKGDSPTFKVRFALRGHLDVVRSVIFTGGGSPSEPELCTAGDDGSIKRWIIPASYGTFGPHGAAAGNDLDITSYFTHRGHSGAVTALAACSASPNFSNGGRALGDGWVFSGGQDSSVKVWERGRVDAKATLDGHTDAVWALCVLPGSSGTSHGDRNGGPETVLLASGGADGRILVWSVSAPPQLSSPHSGSNRGARSSRRANSVSAGSNFPSSPQPSTATSTPFHYSLVHQVVRADSPSPTCISPLSSLGDTFVVSYTDASILVFDARSAEEVAGMASLETYDGTPSTGVNSVVASTIGFDGTLSLDPSRGLSEEDSVVHGATGSKGGVEGIIISGYEDRYIRFFDANSGQCTYTMLAHPSAISSLSLSPDGRELVSAGHDASLRFWSLEKRSCTQEITSHRLMRGEGVCSVVWSRDGRWVVSAGGDGVVKVFAR